MSIATSARAFRMPPDGPLGFLVDTNVLSSRRILAPQEPVTRWMTRNASRIRISVITIAEMRRGLVLRAQVVARSSDAKARRRERAALDQKTAWYDELRTRFRARLEGIDADIAERWADVSVRFPALRDGDKVILATAMVRGFGIATRNVGDFRRSGLVVVDPFDPATWDGSDPANPDPPGEV